MRSFVFLGLAVVIYDVYCKDFHDENVPRQFELQQKNRHSNEDYPTSYLVHHLSHTAPIYSNRFKSGYGSKKLFKRVTAHNSGPVDHGHRYSPSPFSSFNFGTNKYLFSDLNDGLLGLPSISLDEHSTQGIYSIPSIANIKVGNGNNRLASSKNGPVTFNLQDDSNIASTSSYNAYSTPGYTSKSHGLSTYSNSNSGSITNFPNRALPHGTSHAFPSNFPLNYGSSPQFTSSSPSYPVMKNLIIFNRPHGGLSSSSSGSSEASLTFNFPANPESHGNSALPSSSASRDFSVAPPSEIYSSSNAHISLPKLFGSSTYNNLPISSGSSSSFSGSSSTSNHVPSSEYNLSYLFDSSYLNPSSNYTTSTSMYGNSDPVYSAFSSSHENSASNPTATYLQFGNSYMPTYSSSSLSYKKPLDSLGMHSNIKPYLEFISGKSYDNINSGSTKYDTISYSTPDGL